MLNEAFITHDLVTSSNVRPTSTINARLHQNIHQCISVFCGAIAWQVAACLAKVDDNDHSNDDQWLLYFREGTYSMLAGSVSGFFGLYLLSRYCNGKPCREFTPHSSQAFIAHASVQIITTINQGLWQPCTKYALNLTATTYLTLPLAYYLKDAAFAYLQNKITLIQFKDPQDIPSYIFIKDPATATHDMLSSLGFYLIPYLTRVEDERASFTCKPPHWSIYLAGLGAALFPVILSILKRCIDQWDEDLKKKQQHNPDCNAHLMARTATTCLACVQSPMAFFFHMTNSAETWLNQACHQPPKGTEINDILTRLEI